MNFVDHLKELEDSNQVIDLFLNKYKDWMDSDVILVNCGPQYSSRLTQLINHKTSFLNRNKLYEQINLELPLEGESQVWDYDAKEYLAFDKYLHNWIQKHIIFKEAKYLFITNTIFTGKSLNKVRLLMKGRTNEYKFLATNCAWESIFKPDIVFRQYGISEPPVFFWENKNK